ncbi:hypothetical protein [Nannocystis pusilla]|uniref:hypothetical protein n=1 Tax=Nannocystis pusilla TaxID=889268 RepID=UPI003B75E9B4
MNATSTLPVAGPSRKHLRTSGVCRRMTPRIRSWPTAAVHSTLWRGVSRTSGTAFFVNAASLRPVPGGPRLRLAARLASRSPRSRSTTASATPPPPRIVSPSPSPAIARGTVRVAAAHAESLSGDGA